MVEPYYYVRFRWSKVDLQQVSEELGKLFKVELHILPSDETELSIHKDARDELKVTADTLTAHLSRLRAVLSQKEAAPFTTNDMTLRTKIINLYPRSNISPLTGMFSNEPKFEIASA